MTRTAYIHIGLAKTGTTAIQQSATSLQDEMLASGLRFLRSGRIGIKGGQHCIPWRLRNDARADLHAPKYRLAETSAELRANTSDNVLVSSEEFSPLAYSPRKLRDLRALFEGYRLCGIVYVREQVEHFNSFFAELVKDLDMAQAIGDFTQTIAAESRYDYNNWIRPFAEAFDDLVVRPYDPKAFAGGSILQDFFDIVGFEHDIKKPYLVRNRSLSALQVAALQHAVRRLQARGITPSAHTARDLKRRLYAVVQTPQMNASGPYWGIPPQVANQLRDRFRPLNRAFFDTYAEAPYDFPNHQTPRRLNVASFADVPKDVRREIAQVVDALPATS